MRARLTRLNSATFIHKATYKGGGGQVCAGDEMFAMLVNQTHQSNVGCEGAWIRGAPAMK